MSRKGLNIYKRKDGRWEARYIKSRTAQGKPLYGYLYASSYHEARNRLQDVIRLQGNAPNSKEMSKGSVFEFFSIEWLDTFSTSFKESTYVVNYGTQLISITFSGWIKSALLSLSVRLDFNDRQLMFQTNQIAQPLYSQPGQ